VVDRVLPALLRAVDGELDKEAASLALTGAAETLRAVRPSRRRAARCMEALRPAGLCTPGVRSPARAAPCRSFRARIG
jgi:hypothetical protein